MPTRVAALQLPFTYFNTPQEFADYVRGPIELAAQNGAQLLLLPHLTSFMLFGMFDFDAKSGDTLDTLAGRQGVSTSDWLATRAGYVFEFYLHLFQSLASRVEIWLAPGTVLEPENDAFYLSACLFNPQGEVVGRQRQMHLSPSEIQWGVSAGESLRVLKTDLGNFGFLVGEDANQSDAARTLVREGADVILGLAAPSLISTEPSLTDLARAVQANPVFGVQASLVGAGMSGRAEILAPDGLNANPGGILARANSDSDGELVLADLDFDALDLLRNRSAA
jgi:predicted amidohydrolase